MKERGQLPDEEGDAAREYKAMHEENFWSSWLRGDERGKEERMAKPRRTKKKKVKRGKEKRSKNRTKRRQSKEDVRVVFLWRPLTFFVKGEI